MSYVVKLGGHALDSLSPHSPVLAALASDLSQLAANSLVVHGGGPQIADLLDGADKVLKTIF